MRRIVSWQSSLKAAVQSFIATGWPHVGSALGGLGVRRLTIGACHTIVITFSFIFLDLSKSSLDKIS
jgi:hypothetical protein